MRKLLFITLLIFSTLLHASLENELNRLSSQEQKKIDEWIDQHIALAHTQQQQHIANTIFACYKLATLDGRVRHELARLCAKAWTIRQQFEQSEDVHEEIENLRKQAAQLRKLCSIHRTSLDEWTICTHYNEQCTDHTVKTAIEESNNHIKHCLCTWAEEHRKLLHEDLQDANNAIAQTAETLSIVAKIFQAITQGKSILRQKTDTDIPEAIRDIDSVSRSSEAIYPACWQALQTGKQLDTYQENLQILAAHLYHLYYKSIYDFLKKQPNADITLLQMFSCESVIPEDLQTTHLPKPITDINENN